MYRYNAEEAKAYFARMKRVSIDDAIFILGAAGHRCVGLSGGTYIHQVRIDGKWASFGKLSGSWPYVELQESFDPQGSDFYEGTVEGCDGALVGDDLMLMFEERHLDIR